MKKINELKISPAPWFANVYGEVSCHYVRNAQKRERVVAKTNFHFDEHIADAHLVAAAPKLYESLQSLCEYIDRECVPCGENACELMMSARAALAEAAGEGVRDGDQ